MIRPTLTTAIAATAFLGDASAIDLIPFGSTWDYMHPTDGIDPAIADPDFNETWYLSGFPFLAGYNGPAFGADPAVAGPPVDSGTGPAPIGYGTVTFVENNGGFGTELTTPVAGDRGTAYFRTTFITLAPVDQLAVEMLADDGAAIYLNGVPLTRLNFLAEDTWDADTPSTGSETETRSILGGIGGLPAGTHTLAVSLHQTNANSSDLGFDLRLSDEGLIGLPLGQTDFGGALTDFLLDGNENSWMNTDVRVFVLDNGDGGTIQSELIDISGRGELFFSLDLNAEETSGASNFEDDDTFTARLELDDGGGNITTIPLVPAGWDSNGDDVLSGDEFGALSAEDAVLRRRLYANVPDGFESVRLVVEAINDSTTEMFTIQNGLLTDAPPAGGVLGTSEVAAPVDLAYEVGPGEWVETEAKVFELHDGSTESFFVSEEVDVSALEQGLASLTLVASETSTASNFETADFFGAWVETTDAGGFGVTVPLVSGGTDADGDGYLSGDEFAPGAPDEDEVTGTFALSARLPSTAVSARIVIAAENNAGSETFTLSDVRLREAPPEVPKFAITAVSREPGTAVSVTWESEPGAVYDLQSSDDLDVGNWATVNTVTATGTSTTATDDPGDALANFYRVSRRP